MTSKKNVTQNVKRLSWRQAGKSEIFLEVSRWNPGFWRAFSDFSATFDATQPYPPWDKHGIYTPLMTPVGQDLIRLPRRSMWFLWIQHKWWSDPCWCFFFHGFPSQLEQKVSTSPLFLRRLFRPYFSEWQKTREHRLEAGVGFLQLCTWWLNQKSPFYTVIYSILWLWSMMFWRLLQEVKMPKKTLQFRNICLRFNAFFFSSVLFQSAFFVLKSLPKVWMYWCWCANLNCHDLT